MATPPSFTAYTPLAASSLNAIGLWLVKTQAVGTGVSSVTVTGAFSADYDNYLIKVEGIQGSTVADLYMKLGTTSTGYYGNIIYAIPSGTTVYGLGVNNGALFSYIGGLDPVGQTSSTISVNAPYATRNTVVTCPYTGSGTNRAFGNFSGYLNDSTSYTSFLLGAGLGTMTGGTISVYGYRKA